MSLSLQELIKQQAQQCVKCGLCLPHCPTYVYSKNEGHSPRGRIALMEAIANENLTIDQQSQNYLDHCLTCRACEAVCPSHVRYGALIDETRALIHEKNPVPTTTLPWWVQWLSQSKTVQRLLYFSLKFFGAIAVKLLSPLRNTAAATAYHVLRASQQLLRWGPERSEGSPKGSRMTESETKATGYIALFGGCVSNILEKNLLHTATTLLTQLGYAVVQPVEQQCCGALALHQGELERARDMAQHNVNVFQDYDKVLFINSACGLTLYEYPTHPLLKERFATPSFVVQDILDFIADHVEQNGWPNHIKFKFSQQRCVLHVPCSQKNGLKTQGAARLLKLIPNLDVAVYDAQSLACCAGAGMYFWQHQAMSQPLGEQCVQTLLATQPDMILSTNIGCRLQLTMQLSRKNIYIPVLHPLQLLDVVG